MFYTPYSETHSREGTEMTKIQIIKLAARTIVGISTSTTIATVIKQNTVTDNPLQATQLYIGAGVLGAIASDAAGDYTDNFIDQLAESITNIKN